MAHIYISYARQDRRELAVNLGTPPDSTRPTFPAVQTGREIEEAIERYLEGQRRRSLPRRCAILPNALYHP